MQVALGINRGCTANKDVVYRPHPIRLKLCGKCGYKLQNVMALWLKLFESHPKQLAYVPA